MKKFSHILISILLLLSIPMQAAKWTGIKISIDPGYGGSDQGPNASGKIPAKTLVLNCGLDIRTKLEAAGATVTMTRTTDVDMGPEARRQHVMNQDPYMHVSVQLNSGGGEGTETHYHTNYQSVGQPLRNALHTRLLQQLNLKDRSLSDPEQKKAPWIVLNYNKPAAMTFALFHDNNNEYNLIKDRYSTGYNQWLDGHLLGIWDFMKSKPGYGELENPTKPFLTHKWNQSTQVGNANSFGWDATQIRNMAYANGKLYMVYEGNRIRVVKSQTRELLYDLDNTGVVGGYPRLSDVAYFDGKVVACNIPSSNDPALKVYVWDSDVSKPRVLLETTNFDGVSRMGDNMGFYGNWNSGKLSFGSVHGNDTYIINYKITNGTISNIPTKIRVTNGDASYKYASTVRVEPLAEDYYINGKGNRPARLDKDGKVKTNRILTQTNNQANGFSRFSFMGKTYVVASKFLGPANYAYGAMDLFDVGANWSTAEHIGTYPQNGLGSETTNTNGTGHAIVSTNGTSYIETWVLSTNQGVAHFIYGNPPTPTYPDPIIYVGPGDMFLSAPVGETRSCNFVVTGDYLTDNITVTSSNPAITVSSATVAKSSFARTTATLTLTFAPTEAKDYVSTITLSSPGASNKTFTVTGLGHTKDFSLTTKHSNFNFKTSEWNNGNHVRAAELYDGHIYVQHRENRTIYKINPSSGAVTTHSTYNGTKERTFPAGTNPSAGDETYCWAGWSVSMGTDGSLFASGMHGDYLGDVFGATLSGDTHKQVDASGGGDNFRNRIDFFSLRGTVNNGKLAAATVTGRRSDNNNDVIRVWNMNNGTISAASTNHIGKRNAHLNSIISDDKRTATGSDVCWIDDNNIFVTGEYTYPIIYNISNTSNTSTKINTPTTSTAGGGAYFKIGDMAYMAIPNNRRGSVSVYDISNPARPKAVATTENMSSENNPVLHYSIIADVDTGDSRDVATIYVWAPNCGYGVYEFTVPHIWSGETNTAWDTNNNWKYKVEPTSTRDVLIPAVANNRYPILTENITINTVDIESGASLDLADKTLTVANEGITNAGTLKTQAYLPANVSSYGGTVEYYGTGNQTIHAATYTDLNLYKAGIFTLPSTNNLDAVNLRLNAGSNLEIDAGQSVKVSSTLTNPRKADGILLKAEAGKANASLIFHNAQNNAVEATVQMYSKAYWEYDNNKQVRYWQYFGIPFKEYDNLHDTFAGAYIRRHNEAGTGTAASIPLSQRRWIQLQNSDKLEAIKGYEIVQENKRMYTFSGELYNAAITNYPLAYTAGAEYPGQHILSNPYTAAINIKDISFGGHAEATVYQYNTGSRHQWSDGEGMLNVKVDAPGQYIASTQVNAGDAGIPGQIPSMQGFLVMTDNGTGSISIPYSSTEKNTEIQRTAAQPTPWLRLSLADENGPCDIMWLFQYIHATPGFDNGRDARKLIANNESALLYSRNETGDYQINTQADIHNTDIAFKASPYADEYSITFHHGNGLMGEYENIYLKDKLLGLLIDISEDGSIYRFRSNDTSVSNRFKLITSDEDADFVEGITDVYIYTNGRQLMIENHGRTDSRIELYDAVGRLVSTFHCPAHQTKSEYLSIGNGTYIARVNSADGNRAVNKKVIVK